MPRYLRPLIAIVAALAVGVAATLIGIRFATPPAPASVSAPVLAPFDEASGAASSQAVGQVEAVTPGSGSSESLAPGIQARIDALDAAGTDPAETREAIGEADAETRAEAVGDPCSPESGSAPDDCPEGLHSAIFADTHSVPDELAVYPIPNPPATGTIAQCPAVTEGISFAVVTTVPADVTVRYWPEDDPTDVRTVYMPGSATDFATWEAGNAARSGYTHDEELFQHCTVLTDLRMATTYISSSIAVDALRRISSPVERSFDSRGAPTEPPMAIVPVTQSVLYVGVPSTRTPLPDVRAFAVRGDAPADCSSYDRATRLELVQEERVVEVSAAHLSSRNYLSAYSKRVVNLFSVPEGSTIMICARWFDGEAPSWSSSTPIKQRSAIVQSPDAIVPVVTLDRYDLKREVDQSAVRVSAATQLGVACGATGVFPQTEGARPGVETPVEDLVLCGEGAENPFGYLDFGIAGNVVITSTVRVDGEATSHSSLLPLSREQCYGSCELPADSSYRILLPTVNIVTGLCGLNFWESSCTPPSEDVQLGWVDVGVHWVQGNSTGHERWMIGTVDHTTPGIAASDTPRFDRSEYPAVTLSDDGWSAGTNFTVRTDRHVSYRASIAGSCFTGPPSAAVEGQTVLTSTGVWTSLVRFDGLCPGNGYVITVELVDDAGQTLVSSGTTGGGPGWWPGGIIFTPADSVTVSGTATVDFGGSIGQRSWRLHRLGFEARVTDYARAAVLPADRCLRLPEDTIAAAVTSTTTQTRSIHISSEVRVNTEGLYYGVNHDAACDWPSPSNWIGSIETDLPLADLLRGVTITVPVDRDDPRLRDRSGAPFELTLVLRAVRDPRT